MCPQCLRQYRLQELDDRRNVSIVDIDVVHSGTSGITNIGIGSPVRSARWSGASSDCSGRHPGLTLRKSGRDGLLARPGLIAEDRVLVGILYCRADVGKG